jgi:hypothetical protein
MYNLQFIQARMLLVFAIEYYSIFLTNLQNFFFHFLQTPHPSVRLSIHTEQGAAVRQWDKDPAKKGVAALVSFPPPRAQRARGVAVALSACMRPRLGHGCVYAIGDETPAAWQKRREIRLQGEVRHVVGSYSYVWATNASRGSVHTFG